MATSISIVNSALIKLGADTISSLTQDTKAAILANAVFTDLRDEVLRSHPWNFAIKRAEWSPTANTPVYEYDYEYDLPSDCLRVLDPEYDSTDFVIEGRKLLTNESTLKVRFIYRHTDPSEWDAMFCQTLSWRLAQELAFALTQSSERAEQMEREFRKSLSMARSMDGAEGILKGLVATEWTDARR